MPLVGRVARLKGRRRSKTIGPKTTARKFCEKKIGELAEGLVEPEKVTWSAFREDYRRLEMKKWRSETSRGEAERIFNLFEEIVRPGQVQHIDVHTLDLYVAKRLDMPGKRKGDTVSPETIKKELRTIRAALSKAEVWEYIPKCPPMPEIDGYGKDKPFVTEAHFDQIMAACDTARYPDDQHYSAGDFWRALLAVAWVTGIRKSALFCLRWEDVDLDAGIALSRYSDNKGKRDQRHKIGAAVPLLRRLYALRQPGEPRVLPWNRSYRALDRVLHGIQRAVGIHLPCREDHEHSDSCHAYGFHSFRYAHATYNFGRVQDRDLQEQMGHRSFTTTQRYIKYAETHQQREYDVFLPKSLKEAAG